MKALTVTQPWASLIAIGAKRIETRSWRSSYRGPLAIHAAKGFQKEAKRLVYDDWKFLAPFDPLRVAVLRKAGVALPPMESVRQIISGKLPLGCIIAVCRISAILPIRNHMGMDWPKIGLGHTELTDQEEHFGNYEHARYAWILEDIVALETPIPAKGALSLWEWDAGDAIINSQSGDSFKGDKHDKHNAQL